MATVINSTIQFMGIECRIVKQRYPGNDQIALQLITSDGIPVAMATSCLIDYPFSPNQTCIKNYSENQGILEALITAGIIEKTGIHVQRGHVQFPIVRVLL
jgi:hypothetical protein